jgi:metallo-beta-lactamase class B
MSSHRSTVRPTPGFLLACLLPLAAAGAQPPPAAPQTGAAAAPASDCPACAEWNRPQQPFRVYGNTYYVGVHGLASILISGEHGDILIDGGSVESAPAIAASIRALGFSVEDIRLLLNSHVHHDHAGGLAELQRMSGAPVAASAAAAPVLESGQTGPDDPQQGSLRAFAPLQRVRVVKDGETVHVGKLALQAHLTPGHTPGGTTWTWRECEGSRCVHMVYADSLTAVSAPGYLFSQHPQVVESFEHSFRTLEQLPCDVLLTPHPEASDLWTRVKKNEHGGGDAAFIDKTACRTYAEHARAALQKRLEEEARR